MTDTPKPIAYLKPREPWVKGERLCYSEDRTEEWMLKVFTEAVYSEPDFLAMKERAEHAEKARDEAIRRLSCASTSQGVAEGKLAASELAGVIEGWKARAEAAELESQEQARIIGMGSEREAALQGELERMRGLVLECLCLPRRPERKHRCLK